MTIQIYCKQAKANKKDGKARIEACVNDGNRRISITTPYRYNPKDFERLRAQRKGNEVKEIISSIERHYFKVLMSLDSHDIQANADNVRLYWDGVRRKTIQELTREYRETLNPRVGNDLCWSQYNKYLRVFAELDKISKHVENITDSDIDAIVERWKKTYKPSTLNGLTAKVRTVFRYAVEKGYIKKNPCNVRKAKCDDTVETITEDDYKIIKAHRFVDRVERVKEILILLAGTGLSYIDLKQFNPDCVTLDNGVHVYHNKRQKTKQAFYSIILPDALSILRKYDFKPAIPSNQKLNAYLKEIGDICGIDTNITCHKLRHYYARKMLMMGFPIEALQKCLGHSQVRMTSHYAHLLQEQNISFVSSSFKKIIENTASK